MRPIAIFRFSQTEGPAHFAEWLERESLPWHLIAVDAGGAIPHDPREFSGIGMMGGPMSATDALAWIDPLSHLLRAAIAKRVPVIGHCLGGQLLAQSLGARVTRTATPEIGWIDVESVDDARARSWLGGRTRFTPFQWHYDVFDLPDGATPLLRNAFNPNQGYVIDERHVGFQCHVEMTQDLVATWCRTGAAELPERSDGPLQSRDDILGTAPARVAELNRVADSIYDRWAVHLPA